MFQSVPLAPPDAILGLSEAFAKDPNPAKINLSIGVFCDETGKTPILATVKEAERRLLETEASKGYLPIDGSPAYAQAVQAMMFGAGHEVITSRRATTAHTPGGTAALRVAADLIKKNFPKATVWLSDPTWPNHPQIFDAAGVPTKVYPYFDATANGLAFDKTLAALGQVAAGDFVLLHGCCHNPTGIDPTVAQWKQIAGVLAARGATALVDFAYQGFGRGLAEDAAGLLAILQPGVEMLVCSSFSKNFGLYRERVGALTAVSKDAETAAKVQSQVKAVIRANYSNPPSHGGSIVATILGDAALRAQWEKELAAMRDRINGMRQLFVATLKAKGVARDFGFIERQLGMFSFSGLTKDQVQKLRDQYAIYMVGNGRINVAGMRPATMDRLCEAIKSVM
ncbi:MAG: aspartate/tyrosine/aromatic aminotransferase [Opitutaceae bacterium]|nr:aspartate/tyrosine/aromatic aminotransferase [Opitutaceae bacterium]